MKKMKIFFGIIFQGIHMLINKYIKFQAIWKIVLHFSV